MVLLVISGITMAQGQNTQDVNARYLVKSDSGLLKAAFGVNHHFNNGFTTELSNGKLRALKFLGIETEPVQVYHIIGYHITKKPSNPGKPPKQGGRTCFPSDQTPWGIERVYNDSTITNTSGGTGVKVAVLDTGVYKDHLDLRDNVIDCKDTTKRGIKNGCADGNGHGTHVSGTILANGGNDGKGIYGVAPEAKLMAIKVCGNSGSCWNDDVAAGIRYAADHGANIISMSLGGDTQSTLISDAIDYTVGKGVLVIAAAGNDGPADGSIDYPGANVNVVAVGAIDLAENVPYWSSRGINDGDYIVEEKEVEFGAPGVSVESTWNNGCYYTISGTSMATPHIAGLAAKLWQGSALATRTNLQTLAKLHDLYLEGDDSATGFGLPIAQQ